MSGLELMEPTEDLDHRFLNEIAGLVEIAGARRQPAVRPSLQPRQVARAQVVERLLIALARTLDERKGGVAFVHRARHAAKPYYSRRLHSPCRMMMRW